MKQKKQRTKGEEKELSKEAKNTEDKTRREKQVNRAEEPILLLSSFLVALWMAETDTQNVGMTTENKRGKETFFYDED